MSTDDWNRKWDIFAEALDKEPQERRAFLEQVCGGDRDLQEEIGKLIATHDEDPSFLESQVGSAGKEQASTTLLRGRLEAALGHSYIIRRRIGGGGMGDVYLAGHKTLGGKWAVKVLSHDLAQDPSVVARFETEARIGANLQHPNIVKVFDIGEADGFHYLVMSYVDGEDLASRLDRFGALPEKEVVSIAIQICRALECAHDHNVVHRDLKPSNVRIDTYGTVVVLDFGIARVRDQAMRSKTALGDRLGTPLYMSPEQVEGRPIDRRSDFYSLGVMLYEMISGGNPFDAESPFGIFSKQLRTTPPALASVCSNITRRLSEIIDWLIQKDPDGRYQTATEILADLQALGLLTDIRTPQLGSSISELGSKSGFLEDDILHPNPRTEDRKRLSRNESTVLSLIDGNRSIGEALGVSKLSVEEFTRALEALLRDGRVLTSPVDPVGPRAEEPGRKIKKLLSILRRLTRLGLIDPLRRLAGWVRLNIRAFVGAAAGIALLILVGSAWYYWFTPRALQLDASPFAEVEIRSLSGELIEQGPTPIVASLRPGDYLIQFTWNERVRKRKVTVTSDGPVAIREDYWGPKDVDRILEEFVSRDVKSAEESQERESGAKP